MKDKSHLIIKIHHIIMKSKNLGKIKSILITNKENWNYINEKINLSINKFFFSNILL